MPRNGLGTYNLPAGQPVVTGTAISSSTFNTAMGDIATALTQSVSSDGQTPMAANLNMGGFALNNASAVNTSAATITTATIATASISTLNIDGVDIEGTSGASKVGHAYTESPAVLWTQSAINNGDEVSLRNFVSPTEFADVRARTGGYDLTTKINTALSAMSGKKGRLKLPYGKIVISAPLTIPSGYVSVRGEGMGKTELSCTLAMIYTDDAIIANGDYCYVEELTVNGNSNGTNGGSGIHFSLGIGCGYNNVEIKETTQAGIRINRQQQFRGGNYRLKNVGRTGYSDNHGIMIYTLDANACDDIVLLAGIIDTPFRKGITTFSSGSALISNLKILGGLAKNAGLAGIYIGGIYASSVHKNITVDNFTSTGCYNSFNFGNITNLICTNNQSYDTTGYDGMTFDAIYGGNISDNYTKGSSTTGMNFLNVIGNCDGLTISGNKVFDSNRSNIGYAPHINLSSVASSNIEDNECYDISVIKATHGIYENTGSDNNIIGGNKVKNVVNDLYYITGANTKLVEKPNLEKVVALSNGQNDNVAVSSAFGILHVNAPTAAYSITGFAGGKAGAVITVENFTFQTLTIKHNSVGSTGGNRIVLPGAVDLTVPQFGTAVFRYTELGGGGIWMLV